MDELLLDPWPDVKMIDEFLFELADFIPLRRENPPSPDEQSQGYETYFRNWMILVKQHYPEQCQTLFNFWRTGLSLFIEYGNILYRNPASISKYRQAVLTWMFERFNSAYRILKDKSQREAA